MGQKKVLVKINPEGKYVVDIDKDIDINDLKPNTRVALRNDSYTLHKILPTKVDPLVSLMKVEAVPDSTYDMIGGLEKQVMEIKEVIELPIKHPELFESLGVAQPKGVLLYGPPGTGKTLLARAVAQSLSSKDSKNAGNVGGAFISLKASDIVRPEIGNSEKLIVATFETARLNSPSVIFIDEFQVSAMCLLPNFAADMLCSSIYLFLSP